VPGGQRTRRAAQRPSGAPSGAPFVARTNCAKPCRKSVNWSATARSTSVPEASNFSPARDTISRPPDQCCAPSARSTGNHALCARIVPNPPDDAPMIATGLPPNARSASFAGLDSQSMAFLNTPGIELLYSGVTSRSPSARAIASRNPVTAAGGPGSASTSAS